MGLSNLFLFSQRLRFYLKKHVPHHYSGMENHNQNIPKLKRERNSGY